MNLRIGSVYFVTALVLVFVLVVFSCGKGKSRSSGAAVTGIRQAGAGSVQDDQYFPPPNRELSLAEVIEEVEAYEPPGDVDASIFDELRLELIRAFEELGVERFPDRTVSASGKSALKKSDLFVQPMQDGGNAIRWNEILEGDLNGSGEVNIADVAPIASNYLDIYGDGEGDVEDRFIVLAAGGDNEITIADVAVIARNYLMKAPAGYDVWRVPLGGGAGKRMLNKFGDFNLPTVAKGDAERTGYGAARYGFKGSGSAPSSLRFTSEEGDEETWSNGAYYYVIDEREEGGAPPTEPGERKFNILVKYDTPFRVKVGDDVQVRVTIFGDVTPERYDISWGDGNVEFASTTEKEAIFTHLYGSEGVYAPYVVVAAEYEGGAQVLVQDAPTVHVRSSIPFAPTGLSVSLLEGGADLNWDIIDPNPVEKYNVYWSLRRGASRPELLAEGLSLNEFADMEIAPTTAPGISVYYKVTAVRGGNESPFSNEYKWPDILVAPEPPVNLGAEAGNNLVKVTWEASPSAGVDGYRVYFGTKGDGSDKISVAGTDETTREYTVTDPPNSVENGTTYYFWVSALRGEKESDQAGPVVAVPGNVSPTASFTSAPTLPYEGSSGDTISFTSTSEDTDGSIVHYAWDFDGDGTPDNSGAGLSSVEYTYNEEGNFQPALTVKDDDGGKDTFTDGNVTIGEGAPDAKANAVPTSGNPPLAVNFSATGSFDPDGEIVEYAWKFFSTDIYHDYTLEEGSASHEYTDPGTHTATLRVTDDDGKKAYKSVEIYVNFPPTAVANAAPESGLKPLTVNFNANGSTDLDGDIVKWEWDYTDDGEYDWEGTINGNASHEYPTHGNNTARLKVTDNDGAWDTDTVAIHVNAAPIAALSADPTSGDAPLTVNFNASGSYDPFGDITKFEWDWEGDGTYDFDSGLDATVEHTYNDLGTYDATVRVTDDDGASDSASISISVYGWSIITVDSDGNVGYNSSLAVVAGKPAIAYYDSTNGSLKYVRAENADGTSWGTPITLDDNGNWYAGYWASLAIINGNPAIAYEEDLGSGNYDLTFIRASDSTGTNWNAPVVADADYPAQGGHISLKEINGNPAIAYLYGSNDTKDLMYVRAANANGSSWGTPKVLDSTEEVGFYASLADIYSYPAISYRDATNKDLKYIRAADNNGDSWNSPQVVDAGELGMSNPGYYTCLQWISGNPAISYFEAESGSLMYIRSADSYGNNWGSKKNLDTTGFIGSGTSLYTVGANPAIAWFDEENDDLLYIRSTDPLGTGWSEADIDIVDSDGNVGWDCSLSEVNDKTAISYRDSTNGDLKFAIYFSE